MSDVVVAMGFILVGFILSAILPSDLWSLIGGLGFVAYLVWAFVRNRRRQGQRLPTQGWTPPLRDPGSDS